MKERLLTTSDNYNCLVSLKDYLIKENKNCLFKIDYSKNPCALYLQSEVDDDTFYWMNSFSDGWVLGWENGWKIAYNDYNPSWHR